MNRLEESLRLSRSKEQVRGQFKGVSDGPYPGGSACGAVVIHRGCQRVFNRTRTGRHPRVWPVGVDATWPNGT